MLSPADLWSTHAATAFTTSPTAPAANIIPPWASVPLFNRRKASTNIKAVMSHKARAFSKAARTSAR